MESLHVAESAESTAERFHDTAGHDESESARIVFIISYDFAESGFDTTPARHRRNWRAQVGLGILCLFSHSHIVKLQAVRSDIQVMASHRRTMDNMERVCKANLVTQGCTRLNASCPMLSEMPSCSLCDRDWQSRRCGVRSFLFSLFAGFIAAVAATA